MSINTYGTTNLSINTVATNVGVSTKSLSEIGTKTYPRYPTSANIAVSQVIKSTEHFQVIVYSSNTGQGTVSITYPFSVSGDGAGTGYFVIYPIYSYITIVATSIYPYYFRRWATTSGGASPILTGGTTGGANQPYGTAASPITYSYNFNRTDAASYTTIYAVFS
jgi:hypothetical protein